MFQNKRSVNDFIIAVNQAGPQRREKRKLEKIMNRESKEVTWTVRTQIIFSFSVKGYVFLS